MGGCFSFASYGLIDLAKPLGALSGHSTWWSLLQLHELDDLPTHIDQRSRGHELVVRNQAVLQLCPDGGLPDIPERSVSRRKTLRHSCCNENQFQRLLDASCGLDRRVAGNG
jgi:hypothetical protein